MVTLLKFFLPLLNTIPSPCNASFVNSCLISVTLSLSTATPPCSTARLASEREVTRPDFTSKDKISIAPSIKSARKIWGRS